jgi:hypothetical protein
MRVSFLGLGKDGWGSKLISLMMEAARTSEKSVDNYFTPDDGGSTYL